MKQLFLLLLFLCGQAPCMAENLARFTVDSDVYSQLSDAQKNSLSRKGQELSVFIEETIKKSIPENIREELNSLKIKIALSDKPGRDGLFIPAASDQSEHTINIQLNQLHSNGIKALLAHEIFHAIHFHLNPDELPWVREGMAQLFEFITTGELNGMNLRAAIANPYTPLLGDYDPEHSVPAQYGHNMLYFYYLYQQCGKDELIWKIIKGKNELGLKGSFLIDFILSENKNTFEQCQDFSMSAIHFEVAKIHNQIQFLQVENKTKHYILSSEISPKTLKIESPQHLKELMSSLPVLSSIRFPLAEYLKNKGECKNCSIFYAETSFPYTVSEQMPVKTKNIEIILVKLQRDSVQTDVSSKCSETHEKDCKKTPN